MLKKYANNYKKNINKQYMEEMREQMELEEKKYNEYLEEQNKQAMEEMQYNGYFKMYGCNDEKEFAAMYL